MEGGREALRQLGVARFTEPAWVHVFVGVKGGHPGTALEAVAERSVVELGVLTSNVKDGASRVEIIQGLREAAREAEGRGAVFISGLEPESEIIIARAPAGDV